MSGQIKSHNRRLIFPLVVIVAAASLWMLTLRSSSPPPRITITVDSNGKARLAGVPLLDTNLRDGAFAAMAAVGVKGQLAVPAKITNAAQVSNILDTLQSMSRTGLLSTNRSNSYE